MGRKLFEGAFALVPGRVMIAVKDDGLRSMLVNRLLDRGHDVFEATSAFVIAAWSRSIGDLKLRLPQALVIDESLFAPLLECERSGVIESAFHGLPLVVLASNVPEAPSRFRAEGHDVTVLCIGSHATLVERLVASIANEPKPTVEGPELNWDLGRASLGD